MTTLQLHEMETGAIYSFEHTFTPTDEELFADLTGDRSVLTDKNSKRLVHGMLSASFFSTLVDTYCPGPNCLYLSQTLRFKRAIPFGSRVVVRGTVVSKSESTQILTLKTEILCADDVMIDGEAIVQIIGD